MATSEATLMEQLTAAQHTTGEVIQGIIRNFKKDSVSRKTTHYLRERIRRLDAAWAEFEITDNKIRCLEEPPLEHKYFAESYYDKISELTTKYREIFEAAMIEAPKALTTDIDQQTTINDPKPQPRMAHFDGNASATTLSSNSMIRRQKVMIASLKRLLTIDPASTNVQLKEKLWAEIQELHFSIWESSSDPLEEGYDMETYLDLEKLIIENFKLSSRGPEQGNDFAQTNVLPLPKITIPKFNGNYIKWRAFSDLFSQLVDNQQLPKAQKMWYLKSNLEGEAEKLISHLSATADNYTTAWNLLQERYDNPRIIVSTIMQQLLDQPNAGPSAAAIKALHDTTQECLHALNNSGIDTTSWDPMLFHILVKKLDRGTLVLYERTIHNPKELQKIKDLLKFLENRFQSLEAINQKEKSSKVYVSATSAKQTESTCPICKTVYHPLYRCQKFQQLSPQGRLSFIRNQNKCVNCLNSGHTVKTCKSRTCTICKKRHHSLLHMDNYTQSTKQESTSQGTSLMTSSTATTSPETIKPNVSETPTSYPEASSLAAAHGQLSNSYVLLSTAVVKIKTDTMEVECRALLDSGSQVNLITERLAKRLNIAKQPSSINIKGIGDSNTKTRHRINVSMHSRINGFSTRLEALVLPRIIAPQPSQFINIDKWALPKNLTLADPEFNQSNKIDILLGAEHYHQLLAIGQIKLSPHLPTLQNTVLGWIVAGKIDQEHSTDASCGICTEDERLEASIARLWELDEVKTTQRPLSVADKQCEEHFAQNTTRNHQNQFVVRIPFHQNPNTLGDSYAIALNRFFALERRLQKNPELKAKYIEFMDEYESIGHDGVVRVADVQTASGILKRAIQYLAPLPKVNEKTEEGEEQPIQQATTTTNNFQSHSFIPSSDEMPKIKNRRISALPSMPILLIALLAFPLILAAKVEITEFESNAGIHFEGIGNTRVSRSEWNIVTYYELQPYSREMATFAKGTTALQHVCDLINQKTTCINALQTFKIGLADLTAENTLLQDKRVKRGAVNLVGNIANSLFGVLDSQYARHMSNTINAINKNENHLHQLLRNQTSIIDATLYVFKQEESEIKERFDILDTQLTEIVSRIHEDERATHQAKLFEIFISLSVQLSMISARLHRIQTTILTTLYDSHHGKISPKLLSPLQLQNELVRIRNHLPASLQLPVDRDNLLQLYKIMNVKGGITKEHVIFHVTIPLCDPESFETFKVHPIPASIHNTTVAIQPCSDLIAVTAHRDQYVVITEKQWESCITIKEEEFLCPNIQAKFNADADRCLCEISLLNNNSHSECNITPTLDKTSLTQLEHKNHWLYTMMKPTRINAVCGQEHSQITLKGSGLLKISSDCTLKHKSIVIQGHQTYNSSLQSSYTATANISSIVYPAETQLMLDKFHIKNYTEHLKNITAIQHQLHQQILTDLPSQLQHIKYHHATIAYAALILAIGVIVIMIYKRLQRQTIQLNQQRPCPAARQHTTPADYVVTVT